MARVLLKLIVLALPTFLVILIMCACSAILAFPADSIALSASSTSVNEPVTAPWDNQVYLPFLRRAWQYEDIEAPFSSISRYIRSFDYEMLYNAGCEQGNRDFNQPGVQDSIVFLHFGQPWEIGDSYGVRLNETYIEKTVAEIAEAVIEYARGYYMCTSSDYHSRVTIAVGLNNDSDNYTTANHGVAWGDMIDDINIELLSNPYYLQVSVAGASDMELGFNSPTTTREWVDGFTSSVLNPSFDPKYRLFNIADATGCEPYYGDCGTPEFPEWEQEDVWYISYGCLSCHPLPMIYTQNWNQAEQWQHMSRYSFDTHGYKIIFAGVITQYEACLQREDEYCSGLGNRPDAGYKQLFTVLNQDPDLAQNLTSLIWSTDIKW